MGSIIFFWKLRNATNFSLCSDLKGYDFLFDFAMYIYGLVRILGDDEQLPSSLLGKPS